jgi:hypothetical protein
MLISGLWALYTSSDIDHVISVLVGFTALTAKAFTETVSSHDSCSDRMLSARTGTAVCQRSVHTCRVARVSAPVRRSLVCRSAQPDEQPSEAAPAALKDMQLSWDRFLQVRSLIPSCQRSCPCSICPSPLVPSPLLTHLLLLSYAMCCHSCPCQRYEHSMLSSGIGAGAVTTWCMVHGQSPGEAAVITVVSTITALVSMGPCSHHVAVLLRSAAAGHA